MRAFLVLASTAALVAVAACNRGEETPPAPENGAAQNGGNESAATDIAQVMHDRHERYEEIGDAMKGISRELKASSPSAETIQRHAALINTYAPQVPGWFPPGSGPETGRDTRAKAEIWQDWDTFRARAEAFRTAAADFHRTAQAGDIEAIRAAVPELGTACKNCHDRFRAPED